MGRARQARQTRCNGSEPVVEPPQALETGSNLADLGRAAVHTFPLGGEVTPKPESVAGGEATRTACGVLVARLQGHGRAPILPTELLVNVGTVPESPYQPAQPGLVAGKVHRRPRTVGRGGGSVVVRGRESRPHGEGTQRGEQIWNWNVRRQRTRSQPCGRHGRRSLLAPPRAHAYRPGSAALAPRHSTNVPQPSRVAGLPGKAIPTSRRPRRPGQRPRLPR
jgi:hypothetical protein